MRYQSNRAKPFTGIMEKAFKNRNEALGFIQKTEITLGANEDGDPALILTQPFAYTAQIAQSKSKATKTYGQVIPAHEKDFLLEDTVLFSSTGKMTAGSFGTPAGPPKKGGACPSAALPSTYRNFKKLGDVDQKDVGQDGAKYICNYCYANKGNYMHRAPQWGQVLRHTWLQRELDKKSEEEVGETLTQALRVHSSNTGMRQAKGENPRFFRIHDSGDLFDGGGHGGEPGVKALLTWYRVCENLPEIYFWCPTRMWVFPYFADFVRDNPPPENLALRPSALHFNDIGPVLPGFTAGTTAHRKQAPVESGIAELGCPAYSMGGKSCGGAFERGLRDPEIKGKEREALVKMSDIVKKDPELSELTSGGSDCRACWLLTKARVSYMAH